MTILPRLLFGHRITRPTLIMAAWMLAGASAPAQPFLTAVTYGTPNMRPLDVEVADFNGDGKLDAFVTSAEGSEDRYAVLIGKGDGTMFQATKFDLAGGCGAVDSGDFNGDGKLDVVVTNPGAGAISILIGTGSTQFNGPVNYAVGSLPGSVVVGELNGDGKLDLVVTDVGNPAQVMPFLGNGDGTFQPAVHFYPINDRNGVVELGDFNGDGKTDAALPGYQNEVAILLGNGNGTFQNAAYHPTSGFAHATRGITVGDFNNDGKQDVAMCWMEYGGGNNVSILLGLGNGSFYQQDPAHYAISGTFIDVADFNRDGIVDLVSGGSNKIGVLLGKGDGTFFGKLEYGTRGSDLNRLDTGDLNGDGRPDVMTANNWSLDLSVLINSPCFAPVVSSGIAASQGTYSGHVRVSWDAVAGAQQYIVWRSTGSNVSNAQAITTTTATFINDSHQLQPGTQYRYWIQGRNSCGAGPKQGGVTGYIPSSCTPPAVNLSASKTQSDKVQLGWNSITGASYIVLRGTSTNRAQATQMAVTTANSYNDTTAEPGTSYYYWVAVVEGGSCGAGAPQGAVLGYIPSTCSSSEAGNLLATRGIGTHVHLSWNAVTGASSYLVLRSASSNVALAATIGNVAGTVFDDSSATPGTIYYYWVAVVKGSCGTATPSGGVAGYRPASCSPASLTGLTASTATDHVRLQWNAVANASSYIVLRGTGPQAIQAMPIATPATNSYNDFSAAAGATYHYWVAAVDAGCGAQAPAGPVTGFAGWTFRRSLAVSMPAASNSAIYAYDLNVGQFVFTENLPGQIASAVLTIHDPAGNWYWLGDWNFTSQNWSSFAWVGLYPTGVGAVPASGVLTTYQVTPEPSPVTGVSLDYVCTSVNPAVNAWVTSGVWSNVGSWQTQVTEVFALPYVASTFPLSQSDPWKICWIWNYGAGEWLTAEWTGLFF